MIKFEDIKRANESIVTTGIERKDKNGNTIVREYAEVNQRIKAFRMVYPMGTIATEIIALENGVVTMKTSVFDGELLLGTGFAQEKESSSFINKTSFIENCETSSVGRALGMCGFGIDTSVASAEEVQNAINNQGTPLATKNQIEMIVTLYKPEELAKMLGNLKKTIDELTVEEASKMIKARKG